MENKKPDIKWGFAIAAISIGSAFAYYMYATRKGNNPYLDSILPSMARLKYKVYGDGRWNIVGVRSNTGMTNTFDDNLYLFRRINGNMECHKYPITTDPGLYYLNNPMNVKGTGIMAPGQYVDAYAFGKHKGQYEALVQVGPVNAYRDSNRDSSYDFLEHSISSGLYGMNIHASSKSKMKSDDTAKVDKWSAGCQVFKNYSDFLEFINLLKQSGQSKFTYTLLSK